MLREILDVTLYRDVVERYRVKNLKALRLLLKGLLSSTYFSIHKFHNYLKSLGIKISKNTVYNYVEYFTDSMIIFTLKKYSGSYKEVEQTLSKVYLVDNGLLVVSGIEDTGRLLENTVFVELLKSGWTPGVDLFYFKSLDKEVDFVLRKAGRVTQLIQACYEVENPATRERELKGLVKAGKELRCGNMTVITWDYEGVEKYKNRKIKFLPLWKWMFKQKTSKGG